MGREIRVAAIKAQANRMVEDWEGPQIGSKPSMIAVMKDLLAALAAAEAERDDADHVRRLVQQRNAELRQRATRLEALETVAIDYRALLAAYDAQAARLAALERAARAVVSVESGSTWAAISDLADILAARATEAGEVRDGA